MVYELLIAERTVLDQQPINESLFKPSASSKKDSYAWYLYDPSPAKQTH